MDAILAQLRDRWPEAIALILALIAILQSYRANRFSRQLAQYEGSFDKPEVKLGLFGAPGVNRFIILAPITPPPLFFPLPLSVRNSGTATAGDIQLLFRGNENLLPYSREWLEREQPDPSGIVRASFYAKEGHVNTVMYLIDHLHPGVPVNIVNTAILDQETLVESDVSFKAADGKGGRVSFTAAFEYRLELVVFRKDAAPMAEVFRLSVFDTAKQSEAEALESFWKRRLSSGTHPPPRQRWWRRSRSRIEPVRVVSLDPASIQGANDFRKAREVPICALKGADGLLAPDGLFVPALSVALGSFAGTLRRKVVGHPQLATEESSAFRES